MRAGGLSTGSEEGRPRLWPAPPPTAPGQATASVKPRRKGGPFWTPIGGPFWVPIDRVTKGRGADPSPGKGMAEPWSVKPTRHGSWTRRTFAAATSIPACPAGRRDSAHRSAGAASPVVSGTASRPTPRRDVHQQLPHRAITGQDGHALDIRHHRPGQGSGIRDAMQEACSGEPAFVITTGRAVRRWNKTLCASSGRCNG